MTIKCNCADKLDKSNAEHLLRIVDEKIKGAKIISSRFGDRETVEAATEFWNNARSMLETIINLPECK